MLLETVIYLLPCLVEQPETFLLVEKIARLAGIIGANGLYSVIVLFISVGLMETSKRSLYIGYTASVGGFAMIPTELFGMAAAFQTATGIAIVFFSIWVVYVAADTPKLGVQS